MMVPTQLQRELAERLLLAGLHQQDVAQEAEALAERMASMSRFSRALATSLDEATTREPIRHVRLPRPGTWCIVDIIEVDGSIKRMPVVHPDPLKQKLAKELDQFWAPGGPAAAAPISPLTQPMLLTHLSGAALLNAAHGAANLDVLTRIGFSFLLVVPLIVRANVHGAMIFVSPVNGAKFSADEIALALDLAASAALALDNARLYREADVLRRRAEGANESKSLFLSGMSHELRTPLNAIGGFTDLLEMEIQGPVNDTQRQSLLRIKVNQQHLLRLITEILGFTQIESGRTTYYSGDVILSRELASVADMMALAIRGAGLEIIGPEHNRNAVAWADPDRVRQVLLNLIMNAIKYGAADKGTITLACGHTEKWVTASVADVGVGIPTDKLDRIFEPFVQLSAGLADRREGVGLGLAISRDLARGMGGDLSVVSEVGKGTCFTLKLPRARPRGPAEPVAAT
jgi:signal transduction histidine kinase